MADDVKLSADLVLKPPSLLGSWWPIANLTRMAPRSLRRCYGLVAATRARFRFEVHRRRGTLESAQRMIPARYEHGVFRPLVEVAIQEGRDGRSAGCRSKASGRATADRSRTCPFTGCGRIETTYVMVATCGIHAVNHAGRVRNLPGPIAVGGSRRTSVGRTGERQSSSNSRMVHSVPEGGASDQGQFCGSVERRPVTGGGTSHRGPVADRLYDEYIDGLRRRGTSGWLSLLKNSNGR